jgi:signal transduction histidine kinase
MGAIRGAVGLLRPDGVTIELIYHTGYEPELTERYRTFPLSADLPFAEAIRDGAVICVESAEDITERYADLDAALSRHFYASIIAPLYIGARRVGALGIAFPEARSFDDEDRAFVLAVSRLCAQALERAQLFDAAQEAVRLRDIFFSVAAHELKTPLTALLGQAQLLQRRAVREGFLSERDERTVVVIASQANRLNTLVNALLDIARIEQGSLRIEHEPVDLAVLLRQVVAEVQPTSDLHALICEVPERGLVVQGDPLRLEQVVQNLLGNAIKYSPAGGTVLVRAERADGVARLMVSDAGIGIPAEALPQLFTRFYRGRNAAERYIVGMGIGLYVVKEIVTLHGGTVHAESVEGQGSSFTVELPLAALE